MSEGDAPQTPPRVFISYSHDSPEHAERVLALARQLRRDGLDARLDRFAADSPQGPPQGWPRWCAEQILAADITLLVCTETYRRRFLGLDAFGTGRGVKWEAKVIQNVLYYAEINTGFVPVILRPEDEGQIPETVRDASHYLVALASPADPGYQALCARLSRGRTWPPLADPSPEPSPAPLDASIPTEQVWDASERIAQGLERIQQAQETHERRSRRRHWSLAALILVVLCGLGGLAWQQWQTHRLMVDPVALRDRLEAQIAETFDTKLAALKATGAPPEQVDQLYRWREDTERQLDQTLAFVQSAAETERRSLTAEAARVAQERGVEAALELLTDRLHEEGKRLHARARELGEAALFKAELHQTRFEIADAKAAIEQAIDLDPHWWKPQDRLGQLAYEQRDWNQAEQAFNRALDLAESRADKAAVLNDLAVVREEMNDLKKAESLLRQALALSEMEYGAKGSHRRRSSQQLGHRPCANRTL